MKTKRILFAVVLILLPVMLASCQLARPLDENSAQADRFIGYLITTQHLSMEDAPIYADVSAAEEGETALLSYTFPGIDGINCFFPRETSVNGEICQSQCLDEAVCSQGLHMYVTDEGERIEFSGTVYVSAGESNITFYLNPVYQSADDKIYVQPGTGLMFDSTVEGMAWSQAGEETGAITIDGKTTQFAARVEIAIEVIAAPDEITLVQMDDAHGVVSMQRFAPGTLPQQIVPEQNTAYILLESRSGENVRRSLFTPDDESLHAFFLRDDGICEQADHPIIWPADDAI